MLLRIFLVFLSLEFLSPFPTLAADLYLVRHAEKVTDGSKDPELTVLGQERAENLAAVLRSTGIQKIFSSDFKRTRDTAAPLAEALGLSIQIYDPGALRPLADQLLKLEDNALVVGHSNTTAELVDLLGGEGGAPIAEAWEYDRLYLVQTEGGRVSRTIRLHLPPATRPLR